MVRIVRPGLIVALVVASAGCGGGGGGSASPPPPVVIAPQAPTFTSSAAVSVRENHSDIVYRPMASDPQNDTLTYGAVGGPDAAHFTTNAVTREIRFAALPDFEKPVDANGDNIYSISFTASDGTNTSTHNVAVTVTDVKPGFKVRQVQMSGGFDWTTVGYPDGSGRFVQVSSMGDIEIFNQGQSDKAGLGSLREAGLFNPATEHLAGVAFSPNFTVDRMFYFGVRAFPGSSGGHGPLRLMKLRMSATQPDRLDMSTADEIMRIPPVAGSMKFDDAGYLYIGTGTGLGIGEDDGTAMLAQDPNSLAGKILRIDPSTDAFPDDPLRDYAIPASNPFAAGGGLPEIYAMGVARPIIGDFDRISRSFRFADNGTFTDTAGKLVQWQELNGLPSTLTQPVNFGWPLMLGQAPKLVGMSYPGFTQPAAMYEMAGGADIIPGVVYRGPIENFQGYYFFGDRYHDKLWRLSTSLVPIVTPLGPAFFEDVRNQFLPAPSLPSAEGPSVITADTRGNLLISAVIPSGTAGSVARDIFVVEPAD